MHSFSNTGFGIKVSGTSTTTSRQCTHRPQPVPKKKELGKAFEYFHKVFSHHHLGLEGAGGTLRTLYSKHSRRTNTRKMKAHSGTWNRLQLTPERLGRQEMEDADKMHEAFSDSAGFTTYENKIPRLRALPEVYASACKLHAGRTWATSEDLRDRERAVVTRK
jgi:hypothetical protein